LGDVRRISLPFFAQNLFIKRKGAFFLKSNWKIAIVLFAVVLMMNLVSPALVRAKALNPDLQLKIDAHAAVLLEPSSGEIVFAKNPDLQLPPASVTKLMVMLLVLEAVDRGDVKLTDVVAASPEACKMGGSQIWLEPGEQMTVSELLKAVCIVSANDASYALAEHIAGSEENFISLMNKRAKQLSLKSTVYVNTTGLDPDGGGAGNMTSAGDMALLAREVIKHPTVFRWTGVWIDSLRGGKSFLRNTNKLVRFYRGCDGLKTGYTAKAGFCLVASAKRDGVRLVAVVMNSPTTDARSKDISKLLNYGFSKFKAVQIYQGGETVSRVKVFRGTQPLVAAVVPRELAAVLHREARGNVVKTIQLERVVNAPVRKGQKIGQVLLSIDGKSCGQVDLVAAADIKRASVLQIWWEIFRRTIRIGVS
jgi:D-alanyl-D-alanine carboxypeptidase (penicillin-binding protein 5/6)